MLLAAALPLQARDSGDLAWQWRAERVSVDEVDLVATSPIAAGWIVYGSDFEAPEFGPRPARLKVEAGGVVEQPVQSVGSQARTDRNFAGEYRYTYFGGTATFRQRVRVAPGVRQVSGVLDGQSCFEESGLCTLFKEPFVASLD